MRTILHVDMDAFFASVELLHHPEWRGKPLIVGAGPHERGVVSTCSYEARRFGVRSAMPSQRAYALCPQGIFVRPHMKLYQEVSKKVFQVFESFTPYVEGVSIDEAFLDITNALHLHDSAEQLGRALKDKIFQTCGVTCSVGIAHNRLLAKLGSEAQKPNGLVLMPNEPQAVRDYLAPQKLNILWGVGKKTLARLNAFGVFTCGDLQRLINTETLEPPVALIRLLGEVGAQHLAHAAFGISDDTVHWETNEDKSVSHEHTFPTDESNREIVYAAYLALVKKVGMRFRKEKRWAKTAHIKLRDATFRTLGKQLSFPEPTRDDIALREIAKQLFNEVYPPALMMNVRLIGFGVSNIQNHPEEDEGWLLTNDKKKCAREKRERISDVVDALKARGFNIS